MRNIIAIMLTSLLLSACSTNNTSSITSAKPAKKSREMDQRHVIYLEAVKQNKIGNYSEAVKLLKKAAAQGHFWAQNDLGAKYFKGEGIEQNYTKAAYWFERSVNHSYDPVSLYNLGQMYRRGLGVKQDYSKAVEFYRDSAKQGYAQAQYNLGFMYETGLGVKTHKLKALDYYLQAAKQGHSDAQNNLGNMYTKQGNYSQARYWLQKSAVQGNKLAINNLAKLKK